MKKVTFVNKYNLRVARENVGMDVYRASKKVSTKKDCVALWESGKDLPTWVQLRKLAKAYNISELLLVSKKNIQENREIPDFRVGVAEEEKNEIKKLTDLVLKRQMWLEKQIKNSGGSKNKLLGSGRNISNPNELAQYIAQTLNISTEEIKSISGFGARKKVLDYLIDKAENNGIFVGKTISYHKIPVKHMRGLFISNDYCPFIILNRKDALSAQIFSFIHELSHFFRKSDSISNSMDFRNSDGNVNSEEVFCNKVAANLLLPIDELKKNIYHEEDIDKLAEEYKLSKLFVFYRLKYLGKIDSLNLDELEDSIKKESEENIIKQNKKKTSSGGNYYNNMKDSNGELFNRIVTSLYFENKIGHVEASNLLKFSVDIYEY